MKIWKVILATLVIFAAGVLTGAFVVKPRAPQQQPVVQQPAEPPSPILAQQRFLQLRMKRELDLSPEQTAHIEKIFAESGERIKILMDLIGPELHGELVDVREKIRGELRPEQRTKFEELLKHPHRSDGTGPKQPRPGGSRRTNDAWRGETSVPSGAPKQ